MFTQDPKGGGFVKVVVLLSGGLDSMTCLAKLLRDGHICQALSLDYNQSSQIELANAEELCRRWGVPWSVKEVLFRQRDTKEEIHVRNLVFISLAANFAMDLGYDAVAVGAEPEDVYMDSSLRFLEQTDQLLQLFNLRLLYPIKHLESKLKVLELALDLGVPLHLCHSSRSNTIDGNCKTSKLFLSALSDLFGVDPKLLLKELGRLRCEGLDNDRCVYYSNRSFKYAAALFSLKKAKKESLPTFTTSRRLFKERFLPTLIERPLDCESREAQWGLKQALSLLPRPHVEPMVSCTVCKVGKGHLTTALTSLGYVVSNSGLLLEIIRA